MARFRIGRQPDQHLPQPGEIQGDDRQYGPHLDQHDERGPAWIRQAEQFLGEQQVTRRGHRNEFGQALHQAQNDCRQPVRHERSDRVWRNQFAPGSGPT